MQAAASQPDATAHAAEAASARGASRLRAAESVSRTGLRNTERATRNETISVTWIGESKYRVYPGHHRIQSDPVIHAPVATHQEFATTKAWGSPNSKVLTHTLKAGAPPSQNLTAPSPR